MMLYLRTVECRFLILKYESKGEWDHAFVLARVHTWACDLTNEHGPCLH
jgi:hypothetical protein